MTTALIIALTYWAIFVIDESFSWQALVRPIVTGPIVGFILGDIKTGIVMGGMLEAVYMGIVSVGGGAPADAFGSTVICVTFVITGGLSMEAGLALAFPIGTLTARLAQLVLPMHAYLIRFFEKFAKTGDSKKYAQLQQVYRFLFARFFHTITIFLAIWVGADAISSVFNLLPPYVLDGLKIAGGLLPAVGLGILASMTFSKELGGFLVLGYALSAYLGLGTMAVAIISGSIAVIVFFADVENNARPTLQTANNDEEDFFA